MIARYDVLFEVPVELALVLEKSAKMTAMKGGVWIANSIDFSSTVIACISEDSMLRIADWHQRSRWDRSGGIPPFWEHVEHSVTVE